MKLLDTVYSETLLGGVVGRVTKADNCDRNGDCWVEISLPSQPRHGQIKVIGSWQALSKDWRLIDE